MIMINTDWVDRAITAERELAGLHEQYDKLKSAYDKKDIAVTVLIERLIANCIDVSDLIP